MASALRNRSVPMILLDTRGVLAALVPDQRSHRAAADVLIHAEGPFVLSPFVLAESWPRNRGINLLAAVS